MREWVRFFVPNSCRDAYVSCSDVLYRLRTFTVCIDCANNISFATWRKGCKKQCIISLFRLRGAFWYSEKKKIILSDCDPFSLLAVSDDGDSTFFGNVNANLPNRTVSYHVFFNLHVVGLRLTSFFLSAVFSWLSVVVGRPSSSVLASNLKDSQAQS